MTQLSADRYRKLTMGSPVYGQAHGLYWDSTTSQVVVALGDVIVARIDASGIAADLEVASEARGDLLYRAASAWARLAVGASATILASDGTDPAWIPPANSFLAKPRLRVIKETVTRASMTDGGSTSGTKVLAATVPAGAVFVQSMATAITGFTGDVSAAIIIGDGVDTDRYNTGTPSVFTTASQGVALGVPSGTLWHTAAITPTVTITSNADFTNVVAGSVDITLVFHEPI